MIRTHILFLAIAVFVVGGLAPVIPAGAATPAPYSAGDLRTAFNNLLVAHAYLVGLAIGSITRGDAPEFSAAHDTVSQNNLELRQVVAAAYGPEAGDEFLTYWNDEVERTLDYARAAATRNRAGKRQALAGLSASRSHLDGFITRRNPVIPRNMLARLIQPQQTAFTGAADAFAAGDPVTAITRLQEAALRMQLIADPLAIALARQMPDRFSDVSSIDSAWANLRVNLNNVLQEDAYLIFYSFDAATHGREAEFQAAAALQEQTTVGMSKAIGSIYDPATEKAFLDLWHEHNAAYPALAQAAVSLPPDKQQALAQYDDFRNKLDALLSRVNPYIPPGSVAPLLIPHEDALSTSLAALAAGDFPTAYAKLQEDAHYMQHIADPIALAIGQQFPDKFGPGAPGQVPTLGADLVPDLTVTALAALAAVALALGLAIRRRRRPRLHPNRAATSS